MPQPVAIYRFTRPITLLLWQDDRYRLTQLPEESIVCIGNPELDANHMIQGTYRGNRVLLFSVDLEERAELLLTTLEVGDSVEDSKQASSGSELTPLELAQQVADELLGRGHLAFVLEPLDKDARKTPAASSEISDLSDQAHYPLGRCS